MYVLIDTCAILRWIINKDYTSTDVFNIFKQVQKYNHVN